ncbi:LamG-like jellyroll fold domain-containing protein [Acinetobacter baumannii]
MNAITSPASGRTNNYLGQSSSGGNFFNGQVAEVLIYNRCLSAQERQNIRNYLTGKFSL